MTDDRARIGIDLGGTKIESILLAADGAPLGGRRVPTPREDYGATVRAIVALARELGGEDSTTPLGIGTPGSVSRATGRMKNCNSTWLNDRPLREDLERALGRPIQMANDADCLALSEARDGSAAGARSVFAAILGTGVGGAWVFDGTLHDGPNGVAGEWGHNPLPWPTATEVETEPCWCGARGCVESWISGPALLRDHGRSGGSAESAEAVFGAAAKDPLARECVERWFERLARALSSVINLVDPEVIVLGGGLSKIEDTYARIPELWGRWVFSDRVDTQLRPPDHGDASGVRGAAILGRRIDVERDPR